MTYYPKDKIAENSNDLYELALLAIYKLPSCHDVYKYAVKIIDGIDPLILNHHHDELMESISVDAFHLDGAA